MRRGGGAKGWRRVALYAAGALVLLLALAQVILPRVAASVISSRVSRYGKVRSVSVSAWPAVKLLWGSVDSVTVRAQSLRLQPQQAAKLLWESQGVARMDVSAQQVRIGSLAVSGAQLSKRGSELRAQAQTSEAQVSAALPAGFSVRLLKSEAGQVEVQASGGLFGVGTSVDAVAQASEGKLVAHPRGFLVEGLRLTLFSDQHVHVEAVGASVVSSGPLTYELSMRARLR